MEGAPPLNSLEDSEMVTKEQLEGLNVTDTVAIVMACMTVEELLVCRDEETRVGVLSAIVKRETELAELTKNATQGTGAGETMAQDGQKAPDTTFVAPDGKKEGDEDGADATELPSRVKLTRPFGFYDEDDQLHMWHQGHVVEDERTIAEIANRGGSFEVIE